MPEGNIRVPLNLNEVSFLMKNKEVHRDTSEERAIGSSSDRPVEIDHLLLRTIRAAQQAVENAMSLKNLMAKDRLTLDKLDREVRVKLEDFYQVCARGWSQQNAFAQLSSAQSNVNS